LLGWAWPNPSGLNPSHHHPFAQGPRLQKSSDDAQGPWHHLLLDPNVQHIWHTNSESKRMLASCDPQARLLGWAWPNPSLNPSHHHPFAQGPRLQKSSDDPQEPWHLLPLDQKVACSWCVNSASNRVLSCEPPALSIHDCCDWKTPKHHHHAVALGPCWQGRFLFSAMRGFGHLLPLTRYDCPVFLW